MEKSMTLSVNIPPKSRSLLVFFLLAFAISWIVWIPAALASHGLLSFQLSPSITSLLGAFGPSAAALITTGVYDGRAGLCSLFRRLLTWRVGLQWYLFVLFWPALLSSAGTALAVLFGSSLPEFAQPPFVHLYPLPSDLSNVNPLLFLPFVFLQQTLIGSSMGEEIGWRGYALPRLEAHRNALCASAVLGIMWGVWHLPLWLTKGYPLAEEFLGWTLLGLVADSVLFTWVYNNTRESLLLALLFHTSIAITGLFLSSAESCAQIGLALKWSVVVVVIFAFGSEHLSHKATAAGESSVRNVVGSDCRRPVDDHSLWKE
jgi:membrane protease YdiL (CAAX protease family)